MTTVRRLLLLAALLLGWAPLAAAQTQWTAVLTGAAEVPAVGTPGRGTFEATLSADHTRMNFTITYQGLVGATTQAQIHRGTFGATGPALYVLSPGPFASGYDGMTDPVPAGGGFAFLPADVADLQAGNLYVNVRTTAYPNGELRGQIASAVSVTPQTWGRIKNLFR